MIDRLRRLAPPALLLGAGIGAILGWVLGWRFLAAGFPWAWLDAVVGELTLAVAVAVGFVVLFVPIESVLARRLRPLPAACWAALIAGAPWVAAAGWRLNRAVGIRPSELTTLRGLLPNFALLVAAAAVLLGTAWWFHRLRSGDSTGQGRRAVYGVLGAVVILHAVLFVVFRTDVESKPRPDVLVLLVDALRADHLSAVGYPRDTTPALDSLAADGVLFRQAVAHSTFTKSSIASLFTGRYPYQHGVYWGSLERDGVVTSDLLAPSETTLAEVLRDHGYLTAAWVQNSHLRDVMGFGQGFVDYHDQQGGIERIHRRFAPFLRGPARQAPFFAYLHYIDLHDPYRPEPPYDTRYGSYSDVYAGIDFAEWGAWLQAVRTGEVTLSDADVEQLRAYYDGQLRYIDDQVARLLERLKAEGLYDDTLIVLTSDHGDAFYEHGAVSHSTTPYDELVRVPLILKLPAGRFAGTEIDRQVRLVDVFPTILAAAGIQPPDGDRPGCALQPLIRAAAAGEPVERDPACEVAVVEIAQDPDSAPTVAVRTEGWKYIHFDDRPDELYDLENDPGEWDNRIDRDPDEANRFLRLATDVVEARDRDPAERLELDDATIRELKALGYLD